MRTRWRVLFPTCPPGRGRTPRRGRRRGVLMWSIWETSVWKCFPIRTEGGEICKLLLPHGSILIVMRPARSSSAPGELPRASQGRHVPTGTARPGPGAHKGHLQPRQLEAAAAPASLQPGASLPGARVCAAGSSLRLGTALPSPAPRSPERFSRRRSSAPPSGGGGMKSSPGRKIWLKSGFTAL